jgi:hypothetical protein
MTNLTEASNWDVGVYEIQTTDSVVGDNGSTLGIANEPTQNLVNRTLWLRDRIGAAITQAGLTEGTTDNQQLAEAVVLQCATAVALRSVPVPVVPNTQTVLMVTRGQANDGDGLAALYKWVYSSTATDNGSTVIAPTGVATGRWTACGINAAYLGGTAATSYLTTTAAAATYETLTEAAANLTTAENFATSAASTAQTAAETFATNAANTAQSAAETYAAGVASTAQSNAESYALTVATDAQNAAVASAESYASSVASAAQVAAENYAAAQAAAALASAKTYANGTSTIAVNGSTTLPNGVIFKWGQFSPSANPIPVSFAGGNFPNACLNITWGAQGVTNEGYVVDGSISASGFEWGGGLGATGTTIFYQAIGH